MTNTLSTARTGLQGRLTNAGMHAVPFLDGNPVPPVAVITGGQPYVSNGDTFGAFRITLSVVLLAATADNEVMTEQLDEMIATLAIAVTQSRDYVLHRVGAPGQFPIGNARYLGCVADVTMTDAIAVS